MTGPRRSGVVVMPPSEEEVVAGPVCATPASTKSVRAAQSIHENVALTGNSTRYVSPGGSWLVIPRTPKIRMNCIVAQMSPTVHSIAQTNWSPQEISKYLQFRSRRFSAFDVSASSNLFETSAAALALSGAALLLLLLVLLLLLLLFSRSMALLLF